MYTIVIGLIYKPYETILFLMKMTVITSGLYYVLPKIFPELEIFIIKMLKSPSVDDRIMNFVDEAEMFARKCERKLAKNFQ